MKATIIYPVDEKLIREWQGKKVCTVIAQGEDGNRYEIFAIEGSPAWSLAKDTECDIEIKEPPANGKQGKAKLAGSGKFGSSYQRREYKTPTPELAAEAADFGAKMFAALKGRMPGVSDEAIARIAGALINKLC